MDQNPLQLATQGVFVLLWTITVADFARRPSRRRAEIAALFTSLAVIIVLQGFLRATGLQLPWLSTVGALVILAQPYLLLRLVGHFRPLPRMQARLGLALLFGSWALFLLAGSPPAPWALLAIVLAFAYVEAYATAAFIVEARRARGPTRRRLIAVALGSGLLGAVILLAGVSAVFPSAAPVVQVFSRVWTLASALAYFAGFSPPRWLIRTWQTDDLRASLGSLAGRSTEERLGAALDLVGPAAAEAVGGVAGVVLLPVAGDEQRLRVHVDPENRGRLEAAAVPEVELGSINPLLTLAWRERRGLAATDPAAWGAALRGLATAFGGASTALMTPLLVDGEPRGLLVVLVRGGSLFLDDEVGLLAILAEQAAVAIESSRLYVEARGRAAERQALLDLVKAVSEETDVATVAERIVVHVGGLLPASTWSVLLPTADGGLEVVAAGGEAADVRRGRRLALGAGLPGTVMRTGRSTLSDDLEDPDPALVPTRHTRSLLAVPLRHGGAVIGVLSFGANRSGAFGPPEVEIAEIVAAHTAVALGRAQLFDQMRKQNAQLEEATRLKSEFLANMSHELRTPLNAIIGFSELLLDTPEAESDRETDLTYLGTIHRNGKHLLELINDILDLSKIEAGKMDLRLETFDLDQLVRQSLGMVEPLAQQRRIGLAANGSAGVIVADEGKVKQVLLNLLSNAIKFTPEGGSVRVETARLDDEVRITVVDTGIGIAPEHHERIFQEFQQVDGAASRKYEGTGLGLALSRRFAELHGGRCWVESAPGEGSRFHVALPVVEAPHDGARDGTGATVDNPVRPVSNGHPQRPLVLVVEDEPQAANLLGLYLAKGGYHTELARDGAEALEKARALQPDAITLDIILPRLDGWEVLRDLKQDARTCDIPVVVASIVDNQSLGYALGAVDYFVKPIDRRALLARLDRYRVGGTKLRVLAIDDEPDALTLVTETLRPAGYEVETASSGREGVEAATARRPDVVLLDLMMPGMTGFDVVEALRAEPTTRDVSILVVTAKELTAEDKEALNGRVAGVLQKGSVGAVELLAWLDQIVGRPAAAEERTDAG